MRRIIFSAIISLCTITAYSQSSSETPMQHTSTDKDVTFRLFATKNMYTFIRLNTSNGKMWQVQWGTDSKYRFETTLSDIALVSKEDERTGRFFLYPTTNIYTFILVDQIDGRTWQVQWGKEGERMVLRI